MIYNFYRSMRCETTINNQMEIVFCIFMIYDFSSKRTTVITVNKPVPCSLGKHNLNIISPRLLVTKNIALRHFLMMSKSGSICKWLLNNLWRTYHSLRIMERIFNQTPWDEAITFIHLSPLMKPVPFILDKIILKL